MEDKLSRCGLMLCDGRAWMEEKDTNVGQGARLVFLFSGMDIHGEMRCLYLVIIGIGLYLRNGVQHF